MIKSILCGLFRNHGLPKGWGDGWKKGIDPDMLKMVLHTCPHCGVGIAAFPPLKKK